MANSAATLSGKTVEVRGALGDTALANKAFTAPFTMRGGVGGSVRRFNMTGTVSNVTWKDLTFQMTGWPKTHDTTFYLNGGTYSGFVFDGCTFRHGYGAGLANFDTTSESLPENVRVNNVLTANTVSARYPLAFQDPAATGAWVEFFNRGAAVVHYRLGNSAVVAKVATIYSAATAYVPGDVVYNAGGANTYECLVASTGNATNNATYWALVGRRVTATLNSERSASFNPQSYTHIAIISESGAQQVNARTEIGMSEYLANAFAASGSANLSDVIIRNCEVQDMASAFKGLPSASTLAVLIDSRTRRVFMDQSAMTVKPGGALYVVRNSFGLPFARSGIAEALNGDARDPHGDTAQHFSQGTGTIGPLYYAGNRPYMQAVRAGVRSQGIFASDNNYNPSYDRVFAINNAFLGGAPNGLNSGEPGYPVGGAMIYGNTVVDVRDITAQTRMSFADILAGQHVYVGKSLSVGRIGVATYDQSLDLTGVTDAATVFANMPAALTATTRAALDAALTTVGPAAGMGAAATAGVIDWTTTDYAAVIKWAVLPSGVEWSDIPSQAINTMITLPLRRVLNRRTSQAVSPGAGVEWRSVAADGVTELQAWTTAGGTVAPDQFIQIRKQSSAVALTPVDFAITINGFAQTAVVTTAAAAPTVFHTQSGTGPYFRDLANATQANTTRMEFRANIYPTALPATSVKLFTQESLSCDLELMTTGTFRLGVKDGANVSVVAAAAGSGSFVINQWQEFVLDVNQATGIATLTNNGINVGSWSWTPTASPFFQTGREISLLGTTGGLNLAPAGWRVEFIECYFTTGGVRSLRKRVSGSATTVNANSWKLGGAAT